MSEISEIVNVTITRQTQALSRRGFGTILIVGEHTNFADRLQYYQSLDQLIADGFSESDDIYKAVAAAFSQSPRPTRVAVGRKVGGMTPETWVEAITAIRNFNDEWYGLVITTRTAADVQAVAAYIETQVKIFGTASSAAGVIDPASTTDIAYVLEALGYDRTFVLYNAGAANFPEAAWLGRQLPRDPGTETWAFKSLSGVVADNLTLTQVLAAEGKEANTYTTVAGVNITREGVMVSGEYIDIIHGVDWLQARITERVFALLANSPKVPYTDRGITAIESEIRAQLQVGVDVEFLADDPAFTVTSPRAADVDPQDKANRELNGVKFTATLAGAIHKASIQGTVTL